MSGVHVLGSTPRGLPSPAGKNELQIPAALCPSPHRQRLGNGTQWHGKGLSWQAWRHHRNQPTPTPPLSLYPRPLATPTPRDSALSPRHVSPQSYETWPRSIGSFTHLAFLSSCSGSRGGEFASRHPRPKTVITHRTLHSQRHQFLASHCVCHHGGSARVVVLLPGTEDSVQHGGRGKRPARHSRQCESPRGEAHRADWGPEGESVICGR